MVGNGFAFGMVFAAGMVLGVFFFGGLWLTVRRLPTARWPALLALGSFWGRSAVCVAGFYFVMGGDWARLVTCFLGFLSVRLLLVRRWRPRSSPVAAVAPRGEPI